MGGGGGPWSAVGLEGMGGDCIAKSSSPRSMAAMREVLTRGDFSLARATKLYPTLKEQLPEDNGPREKQQSGLSSAGSERLQEKRNSTDYRGTPEGNKEPLERLVHNPAQKSMTQSFMTQRPKM